MLNSTAQPLFRKLQRYARLSGEDRSLLHALVASGRIVESRARQDIVRENDRPKTAYVILEGWCARYRSLEDGRKQLASLLLPGDLFGLDTQVLKRTDHSVATLTRAILLELSFDEIDAARAGSSRLHQALIWATVSEGAIQREWSVSLGQRDAIGRLAQLFCELFVRSQAVGLCGNTIFDLPLTQIDLAEATGMTAVHVNRMLQELRSRGLISLRERSLEILDFAGLSLVAMFSPDYLHLDFEGKHLDAEVE